MSEITIPGFELERTLGAGGFGTVWLARQPSVDRLVAVKIGHQPLEDAMAKTRFERECQALGRLSGRSDIVAVHVAGSLPDGRPYLVLEYVNGGTLWDQIQQAPLSTEQLITVGDQLCIALDAAHQANILHRDIKPENVFVRADGSIVLGDFGIAAARTASATRSSALAATIPYTAPEVLSGERATVSSDLYAVGATILAAATRAVPFVVETDESLPSLLGRVLNGTAPDIRQLGYPDGLAAVVERLMSADVAARPQSATEARALFAALAGSDPRTPAAASFDPKTVVAPGSLGPTPSHEPVQTGQPDAAGLGLAAPGPASWNQTPGPSPAQPGPGVVSGQPVTPGHVPQPGVVSDPSWSSGPPAQPGPGVVSDPSWSSGPSPAQPGPGVVSGPPVQAAGGLVSGPGAQVPVAPPSQAAGASVAPVALVTGSVDDRSSVGGATAVLLGAGAAALLVILAVGAWALVSRTDTGSSDDGVSASGTESGSEPGTDAGSGGADPDAAPTSSGDGSVSTTTTSTAPTTTEAPAPELAPIDIPLTPTDVGLPASISPAELVVAADQIGFCEVPIDLSAVVERRHVLLNNFNANDQVSQTAIRFESEAAASAFMDDVASSLSCSSWDSVTADGSQQRFTVAPIEIVPRQQFADDTRAWESTVTFENGFEVTQQYYFVRRFDRVLGLGSVSDEPEKAEQATSFMALMIDRLGYDT